MYPKIRLPPWALISNISNVCRPILKGPDLPCKEGTEAFEASLQPLQLRSACCTLAGPQSGGIFLVVLNF